jgi:hypothetical protein
MISSSAFPLVAANMLYLVWMVLYEL